MRKVAMILRRPPYGDINAAEAVRHALGGAADGLEISIILLDAGVLLVKKGQNETATGFTNLEAALKDSIDMGVIVYADKSSLREQYMEAQDITDGVKIVNGAEISELLKEADQTMIF